MFWRATLASVLRGVGIGARARHRQLGGDVAQTQPAPDTSGSRQSVREAQPEARMTNAYIYARFSPRRRADQSLSNETQLDLSQRYCRERSYTIGQVFEDAA